MTAALIMPKSGVDSLARGLNVVSDVAELGRQADGAEALGEVAYGLFHCVDLEARRSSAQASVRPTLMRIDPPTKRSMGTA